MDAEKTEKRFSFICGLKAGIPVAIGYLPIAISFGLLSISNGIPDYLTVFMSFIVFAGASQFAAVNLFMVGASPLEIILTTFILNFRHFLMSSSISQRIEQGTSKKVMGLLAFGVTDESFAVASIRKEKEIKPQFFAGLILVSYSAWVLGTAMGAFMFAGIPDIIINSMGIALYAMFIGLIVPSLRKSKPVFTVCLLAAFINTLLYYLNFLSTGWNVIISTVIAAGFGTALYSKEDGK